MIFLYFDPLAPEVVLGKLAVLIVSVMSTTLFTWELSRRISNRFVPGSEDNRYAVALAAAGIICSYIALNMLGDAAKYVISTLGQVGYSLLAFVLPPVYYLIQFKSSSLRWLFASILVLATGLAGTTLSIIELVRHHL
jgi:hypothetical protein